MEALIVQVSLAISIFAITSIVIMLMKVVNWMWLRPKKLEKYLRNHGYGGNPYRLLRGDILEFTAMSKEAKSQHIKLSDDVSAHALPYIRHIIKKYGKKSFIWFGPRPNIQIVDPEQIKEILCKPNLFHKEHLKFMRDTILGGLISYEDEKWTKHRRIIKPAFHFQKLMSMLPAIHVSCAQMINKWERLLSATGSAEVDVWSSFEDLSCDVFSRTAFGTNYEEGGRIFLLQKEEINLTIQLMQFAFLPGWMHFPTQANKRLKYVIKEIQVLLRDIIIKREKAIKLGETTDDDLLGSLLESNTTEIKEHEIPMTTDEVMKEFKLFYFAGSETTSDLLVWTLVMLSRHPEWQTRAREEVLQAFGCKVPGFDRLNHLKIVTMILLEVLRLYPPLPLFSRAIPKDTKLGDMNLPAGMGFTIPVILIHYDPEIWGTDSHEFKPERFSEGIIGATKGKFSYIPFGGGPRICIGQNFSMMEAKMVIAMILQRFSFELSPSYAHAPFPIITLQPQHGAPIILHRL